jgi:hypothetical protein
MAITVWFHFWVLYSIPLIYMSVFVPLSCCHADISFFYFLTMTVVQFELKYCGTSSLFMLTIALVIQGRLCFLINLRIVLIL